MTSEACTGDRFPTNEPWKITGSLSSDRLPMLLWEGELRRGYDLLVIVPTIWEWDGGNPQLRSQFTQDVNQFLGESFNRGGGFVLRSFTGGDVGGAGDRPIGMLGSTRWNPYGLILNFDTARRAATTAQSRVSTGVVEIRYRAETEDYSLYFKIERLR